MSYGRFPARPEDGRSEADEDSPTYDTEEEDSDDDDDDDDDYEEDDGAFSRRQGPNEAELLKLVVDEIFSESSENYFESWPQFQVFERNHSTGLGFRTENKGNVLHHIIADWDKAKSAQLLKAAEYIAQARPNLLEHEEMEGNGRTPLYQAIVYNNFKLVSSLIEGFKKSTADSSMIHRVLKMNKNTNTRDTCLHLALKKKIKENKTIKLREDAISAIVSVADDDVLCVQNEDDMTALHLAVIYEDIGIKGRKKTIQDMVDKSDKALGLENSKKRSVIMHHLKTRKAFEATKEYTNLKVLAETRKAMGGKAPTADVTAAARAPDLENGFVTGKDHDPKSAPMGKRSQGKTESAKPNHKERQTRGKGGLAIRSEGIPRADIGAPTTAKGGTRAPQWENLVRPNQGARRDEAHDVKLGISRQNTGNPPPDHAEDPNKEETESRGVEDDEPVDDAKKKEKPSRGKKISNKVNKKSDKEYEEMRKNPETLEKISKAIQEAIKLRCMRTRSPRETTRILYGNNPDEIQVYFDSPCEGVVQKELIVSGFESIKFDPILQYVAFPQVTVKGTGIKPRKSRTDMQWFFKWLREKGVKRIVKVIVHDMQEPAHSDEVILKSLDGLQVEELHWMKMDLDPETIQAVNENIREVYLSWSGNNTALRAWGEPDGLPKIKTLTKIYLDLDQSKTLERDKKTTERIKAFEERLNACRSSSSGDDVAGPLIEVKDMSGSLAGSKTTKNTTGKSGRSAEKIIVTHQWLDAMDQFGSDVDWVWDRYSRKWKESTSQMTATHETPQTMIDAKKRLKDPIVVALIDDGVDILDETLTQRNIEGQSLSFEQLGENEPATSQRAHAFYQSARGHGTIMANMIFRVCPMAKVYVIRMQTLPGADGDSMKALIDPRSAAAAIHAAVDKKVNVISMSWTIDASQIKVEDAELLTTAIARAQKAQILLFCSSSDGGHFVNKTFPSCVNREMLFRVGAAQPEGIPFSWAGPESELDFVLPGVDVVKHFVGSGKGESRGMSLTTLEERLQQMAPETGSSVATALAAGLAALLLTCVKLAAMHYDGKGGSVNSETVRRMQEHDHMNAMLLSLNPATKTKSKKFLEVWYQLNLAKTDRFERGGEADRLEMIAEICRDILPPLR